MSNYVGKELWTANVHVGITDKDPKLVVHVRLDIHLDLSSTYNEFLIQEKWQQDLWEQAQQLLNRFKDLEPVYQKAMLKET